MNPSARAVNECGSSASERYALHSSTPSTPYSEGDIVRTGTGNAKRLWRAGATVSGTPGATGASGWTDVTAIYATLSITCSSSTSGLSTTSDVHYTTPTDLALIYDRSDTILRIRHLARKAEVAILQGTIAVTNNNYAVLVGQFASGQVLRFTMASGATITSTNTGANAGGVYLQGGGSLFFDSAGDISSAGAARLVNVYTDGGSGASIDVNITGGVLKATGSSAAVLNAETNAGGSGTVDVDITGATTRLSASAANADTVIRIVSDSLTATSTLDIGAGVIVCRGTLSAADVCSQNSGRAIFVDLDGVGASTITNAGSVFGDIVFHPTAATITITNQATGVIVGSYDSQGTNNNRNSVLVNAGTWTTSSSFQFGTPGTTDSDSFTNSGTFIINYGGTAIAMSNLEAFTLESAGTVRFVLSGNTLPTAAMLNIGGATAALAGTIELTVSGGLPSSGTLNLITGTGITASTVITGLSASLGEGFTGTFAISSNTLTLTFVQAPVSTSCGTSTSRTIQAPGVANREVLCDSSDSLLSTTDLAFTDSRLAVLLHGTAADGSGSIRTIRHTGVGAEVHILSGSVVNPDRAVAAPAVYVGLATATQPARFVLGADASVVNRETAANAHAVFMTGARALHADIAGNIFSAGGHAISAVSAAATGSVDINITGGTISTVSSTGSGAIYGSLTGSGTGAVDISITGADTRVNFSRNSTGLVAAVSLSGAGGADRVFIGPGARVCRGTFDDDGECDQSNQGGGYSVYFFKAATGGSSTLINEGSIWGSIITISSVGIFLSRIALGDFSAGTSRQVRVRARTPSSMRVLGFLQGAASSVWEQTLLRVRGH